MTRNEIMTKMCNLSGLGLEIAPLHRPVLPKSKNHNVETLDCMDRVGLINKYKNHSNVDKNIIEEVDYIWRGGSYVDAIKKTNCYDFIIASHVIEHAVCLINFLNDCMKLLKPGGVLSLAIPDKRYTFDYFRSPSTIGDVLSVFYSNNKMRHSLSKMIECMKNTIMTSNILNTLKGEVIAKSPSARFSQEKCVQYINMYNNTTNYIDFHAWVFTKTSFALLFYDMQCHGFFNGMQLVEQDEMGSSEFFVRIVKCNKSFVQKPIDRFKLLNQITKEQMKNIQANIAFDRFCSMSKKYIYGTGALAKTAILFLDEEGVKIDGFIVSDEHNKKVSFMNRPVYYLSEIDFCEKSGVLLGLNYDNKNYVLPLLKSKRVKNII